MARELVKTGDMEDGTSSAPASISTEASVGASGAEESEPASSVGLAESVEAAGEDDPKPAADDEDTGAQIAPIVRLEEVAVSTGEENELVLLDLKAKLYRFDKAGNQWKERGVGQVKLLEHKETAKVRLLLRQSRTLKICANHLVIPETTLQEHAGSEKSWVWHAADYSDGELKDQLFCIRLGSIENAQKFKSAFEAAQDKVRKAQQPEEAGAVAEALENLSVSDSSAVPEAQK